MLLKYRFLFASVVSGLITASCSSDTAKQDTARDSQPPAATTAATTPAPAVTTETAATPVPTDAPTTTVAVPTLADYQWQLVVTGAAWGGRAGLRVVEVDNALFLMGGRTPRNSPIPGDSDLWGDVWRSDDQGVSWTQTAANGQAFAPRAYFQALNHNGAMYVIGGQDFGFPSSNFYHDVWRSADGVTWEQTTAAAPWSGRAGLMAASLGDELYVFGGSRNDDSAVVGPTGPVREYFNDVWRSADGGVTWEQTATSAPWSARAGAAVVVHNDAIYLLGGEVGFVCQPYPGCDPPYFNDVWRTTDGVTWELVTEQAAWSPRPGHQCESVAEDIVCFGGFGQGANPIDMWASADGGEWRMLDQKPWNASAAEQGRYDFDSTVINTDSGPAILTVGGDRETFEFGDPNNWTRVDSDVWSFVSS